VLEIGTPICCDADMYMLPRKPAQIIIQVQGGIVQSIHASVPDVRIDLLDWDNLQDRDTTPAERRKAKRLERKARKMTEVY
jgi:hypothetical protein